MTSSVHKILICRPFKYVVSLLKNISFDNMIFPRKQKIRILYSIETFTQLKHQKIVTCIIYSFNHKNLIINHNYANFSSSNVFLEYYDIINIHEQA